MRSVRPLTIVASLADKKARRVAIPERRVFASTEVLLLENLAVHPRRGEDDEEFILRLEVLGDVHTVGGAR